MDPSRTPLSPGGAKRRRSPPSSGEQLPMLPPGPQQSQQTSLPSIRQLHPYLPPSSASGIPQHISNEASAYGYGISPQYAAHVGQDTGSSQAMNASQRDPGIYGAGESEADDLEQHSPPKKKRRRQALSCTECKRRKIKCDRSQPCTPCTRRGEEAGCQWHIVEPVEKYVTKAEFDELKSRYEQLEAFVRRYVQVGTPAATVATVPYYQMGVQQGISGIMGDPVSSYAPGASSSIAYSSGMMVPPAQATYQQHGDASQSTSTRFIKPEGAQSPMRHTHPPPMGLIAPGTSSPTMSTAIQSPSQSRHRVVVESSSPTTIAAKTSPLSLASITSPYHPDQSQSQSYNQSKNYHAQTLILGERLRPETEDPTIFFVKTHRLALDQLAAIPARPPHRCMSIASGHLPQVSHSLPIICIPDNKVYHDEPMNLLHGRSLVPGEKRTGIAA